MNSLTFDDRVAIVTGAGGNPGLGRSYALALAARGASIVVNDIGFVRAGRGSSDNAAAEQVALEIRARGGQAIADTSDISTEAGCASLVKAATNAFGRLDIVINNAGKCIFAEATQISSADIEAIIAVNLLGVIWMTRAALPVMREQRYGRIVNTTSGSALGIDGLSAYGAAKAGVVGYTRAVAAELGTAGPIRINLIAPTAGTRMANANLIEGSPAFEAQMSFSPDAVSPVALYLAHQSCVLNGEWISAAGGRASRVVFQESAGKDGIATPEDMAAGIDRVLVMDESSIVYPMSAEVFAASTRPYVV